MKNLQLKFIVDPAIVRWFRIINQFERNHLVTKRELAESNQVSERTIQTDINKMKDYFSDSTQIISTKSGYFFQKESPVLFLKQKEQLLENEILFELLGNVFYGELEDMNELIDRFHLSEATFRRYLKQIQPVLKEYSLTLSLYPIDLKGNEANIRKFFKDFYYEGEMTPHTLVPPRDLHELVQAAFYDQFARFSIGTGTSPAEFYYSLYIAIERVRQGKNISLPTSLIEKTIASDNFQLMFSLQERIRASYQVSLSEEDFCWLYLVTVAKRPLDRIDQEEVFCQELSLERPVISMTDVYVFDCFPELQFTEAKLVLRAFFLSRVVNELVAPIQNKIIAEVIEKTKQDSNEIYDRNYKFLAASLSELKLTEAYLPDIAASLTLLVKRLQEHYIQDRKKIIFLLEGDLYICQSIRSRVIHYFGDHHDLFFMTIQALSDEFLTQADIDLVVTNYSDYLSEYTVNTDYLLLKTVPDHQDWQLLFQKIEPQLIELMK